MKIKLTESKLKQMIAESVKKVLNENIDYEGNYQELIKNAMHQLYDLEGKVPYSYRPKIHGMAVSLEAMYQDIQRNHEFDNWNN